MVTNCQNCNTALHGNYCSNCGQTADTHKINVHFLWHDIQHGLLHLDKGILYTAKELFTRPGHSIREFIEGKRVKHFKPISLVIVLASIYGVLFHFFKIDVFANYIVINGSGERANQLNEIVAHTTEWVSQHYSLLALFQIPIFAIGTYIGFRKAGYNFIEHLIINAFLVGQRLILHIIVFPLYYIYNETPALINIDKVVNLFGYVLAMWALFQFFKNQRKKAWKMVFSLAISSFIIFLILLGVIEYVFNYVK